MEEMSTQVPTAQVPSLPPGSFIELPGRGTVFVRDSGGAAGRPVLVLFHGWLATADLNWGFSYETLSEHFRVVAFDQRGHGRGLKSRRPFRFADCADDAVAVLDALEIEQATAVGYSMGGPVAMELARRHSPRVNGLVLCATAGAFSTSPISRLWKGSLGSLATATRLVPDGNWRRGARRRFITRRASGQWQDWIADELEPSDLTTMLEAGAALMRFNAMKWTDKLAVPTSSLITTADSMVPMGAQLALARSLPTSTTFTLDADHLVCFDAPDHFTPVLLEACLAVDDLTDR